MTRLVIVGAGGHGKVVADAASESGWSEIVFLDGAWPTRSEHAIWPIIGSDGDLSRLATANDEVIIAIGNARRRSALCSMALCEGLRLAQVTHPSAVVSKLARIGRGSVVFAGAVVNAGAIVGEASIVNTGAIVDHDCVLAEGVHICPGVSLAGGVTIGARSWVGIGSSVRQGILIGADVMVGAGSVVVRDLPDGVTAYGVPARISRR